MKKLILTITLSLALMVCLPIQASIELNIHTQQETELIATTANETENEDISSESISDMQRSKSADEQKKELKQKKLKANDEHGFTLTIMSMCVVLGALAILSILFLIFGTVSKKLQQRKKMAAKGINCKETNMTNKEELDSGEVIAAIAMAIAQHFNAHDQENYDLTIKRMKRAYSPWNSKIYNMRDMPMLRKFFK